jgi:hypothetical protein
MYDRYVPMNYSGDEKWIMNFYGDSKNCPSIPVQSVYVNNARKETLAPKVAYFVLSSLILGILFIIVRIGKSSERLS